MSRIALVVALFLVALEVTLSAAMGWYVGWGMLLSVVATSAVIGVVVIGYVLWRYGAEIAEILDSDEALKSRHVGGLMLALAGLLMLIPSLLTDVAGLILLLPAVRRRGVVWIRRRSAAAVAPGFEGPKVGSFEAAQTYSKKAAA
jgi:UPF0716 protein FxsA